jgi:hypothetical protein
VLESKENPYASAKGNASVQGSVVTIILSRPDGTEISVEHTSKPISIRLTRPMEKQSIYRQHQLNGTSFQYHKVSRENVEQRPNIVVCPSKVDLSEDNMTLSVFIRPHSPADTFAIYISHGINETAADTPTESKFDLVFLVPNRTVSTLSNEPDYDELRHTVFMSPDVHRGNGTYIIGVKLISESPCTSTSNSFACEQHDTTDCRFDKATQLDELQRQLHDQYVRFQMSILA